jgi:antitoxin ParD1/3/4
MDEEIAMAGKTEIAVQVDPQMEEFIRQEMNRGSFSSASAYVEALLRERFEDGQALQTLEQELDRGLADIEAGRITSAEEAFDSVRAELGLNRRRA